MDNATIVNRVKAIRTTNRNLEGYLYGLGIKPKTSRVLWDGMVEWSYDDSPELRQAVRIYRQMKVSFFKGKRIYEN